MEKYFIVTEKSSLRNDYLAYLENSKKVYQLAKQFMKENEIETTRYGLLDNTFYIVPTKNDKKRFANQLCKTIENNGLVAFKKTSKIGRQWTKTLERNSLKVLDKPFLPLYFHLYGRCRWRLFEANNIVYASFEADAEDINTPDGFIEIKASEFYKVIEELEKAEKQTKED